MYHKFSLNKLRRFNHAVFLSKNKTSKMHRTIMRKTFIWEYCGAEGAIILLSRVTILARIFQDPQKIAAQGCEAISCVALRGHLGDFGRYFGAYL